jgi:hypothetical protein
MSLRSRIHAPAEHPANGWTDTIHALAEVHRARRAIADGSRWPLGHACSHGSPEFDAVAGSEPDVAAEPGRSRSTQPFCCRALA